MFVIVFIFILTGCTDNKTVNIDELIVEKSKAFELNEDQFLRFQITYDEFKENMKDIVVNIDYLDNELIIQFGEIIFLGKDLLGLTLEEINLLVEDTLNECKKEYEEKGWDFNSFKEEIEGYTNASIEVKFSDVYDVENKNWKYVYSQTHMVPNNNYYTDIYTNKRYWFVEEDGDWKITGVDERSEGLGEHTKLTKEELLNKIGNNKFNNEPVEYTETYILREGK